MARVECMQGLSMVVILDGCACQRGLARLERRLIEGGRLVIYDGMHVNFFLSFVEWVHSK